MIAALCACGAPNAEVIVELDAQRALAEKIVTLETVIRGGPRGALDELEHREAECAAWPRKIAFAARDGDDTRVFELELTARDLTNTVAARALIRGGYRAGQIGALSFTFDPSCTSDTGCIDDRGTVELPDFDASATGAIGAIDAPDPAPPALGILFPPNGALVYGRSLTVTATVGGRDAIRSVDIQGTSAELDRCVRAHATVALGEGEQSLSIVAADAGEQSSTRTVRVKASDEALLAGPYDVVIDPGGANAYLLMDGALVTVDLASGETARTQHWSPPASRILPGDRPGTLFALWSNRVSRVSADGLEEELISGPQRGSGPAIARAHGFVFDEPRGRLVLDEGLELQHTILSVNVASGDRRLIFSENDVFTLLTSDLAVDESDGRLFFTKSLDLIELAPNGSRIAHDCASGAAYRPTGFSPHVLNNALIAVDYNANAVFRFDLTTDRCTELSGPIQGTGPTLVKPFDVVLADQTVWPVERFRGSLLKVELATGDRVALPGLQVGSGPPLLIAQDARYSPARREIIVAVNQPGALYAVSAIDASRRLLAGPGRGAGAQLGYIQSIAVDTEGAHALVTQASPDSVLLVDLASGDRELLTDRVVSPHGVTFAEPGYAFVVESVRSLLKIELSTHAVDPAPAAAELMAPEDLAFDPVHARLLIADPGSGYVTVYDPVTATAELLAEVESLARIAVAPLGDRALVLSGERIVELDLTTNKTAQRAGEGFAGMPLFGARGLAVDWTREVAFVADSATAALYASDLASGETVLMSR